MKKPILLYFVLPLQVFSQKNLVSIIADDLGMATWVFFYHHGYRQMAHFRSPANKGMVFTNA